jgi:hypothetical protein
MDRQDSAPEPGKAAPAEPAAPTETPASGGIEPDSAVLEDRSFRDGPNPVVETVEARNSFVGTISIGSFGGPDRSPVPTADLAQVALLLEDRFVEPAEFQALSEAVAANAITIAAGTTGCGRLSAAVMALHRGKHAPLLQLPSDLPIRDLVAEIERTSKQHPDVGFVVEQIDATTVEALEGFDGQRLRATAVGTRAAVVFTIDRERVNNLKLRSFSPIKLSPPASVDVLRTHAECDGTNERALASALEVLALLPEDPGPSSALSILQSLVEDPDADREALADRIVGQRFDSVLDEWLGSGQRAWQVAPLAAAAVLDGANVSDAGREALRLCSLLEPEPAAEESGGGRKFSSARDFWPARLVEVTGSSTPTHFGRQPTDVVRVVPPLTRTAVIEYCWRRLGPDFRGPFTNWLLGLAEEPRLRASAAIAAGTVFLCDPLAAERDLLRPWALDNLRSRNITAGHALGVPAALGFESTSARALARAWGASANLSLLRTAVIAYGSWLGAWDDASAAPVHLLRIGFDTPELSDEADRALAELMSAGAGAQRVRQVVMTLLLVALDDRASTPRVFGMLPRLVARLVARDADARASWLSLWSDPESPTRHRLARVLTVAFVSSGGYAAASASIHALVTAVAKNNITEDSLHDLIREMKRAASDSDERRRLAAELRRSLATELRGPDESAAVARSLVEIFYPPEEAGPHVAT